MKQLNLQGADVEATARPPLKWAGGKRWLVPHLQHLDLDLDRRRLVEPFMGGLAVTLGLNPKRALLNDFNPHLVNFYRQLHDGLEVTLDFIHSEDAYYAARARFNQLIREGREATAEAAQLFYYLNRTCFNGLCRFNRKGEFNVPYGRYKTIRYATTEDFHKYTEILSRWDIMDPGDFERVQLQPDDVVYADPPYDESFTDYSQGGFGWEDQIRLADHLSEAPCPVVASNHATNRIVKLYRDRGFVIHLVEAPRFISRERDGRVPVLEMLATQGLPCTGQRLGEEVCTSCGLTLA